MAEITRSIAPSTNKIHVEHTSRAGTLYLNDTVLCPIVQAKIKETKYWGWDAMYAGALGACNINY